MQADGSISIKVSMDDKEAQKELDRLERKMQKTASAIDKLTSDKLAIEERLEKAGQAADETREKIKHLNEELNAEKERGNASMVGGTKTLATFESEEVQQRISANIARQEEILKSQVSEVDNLAKQYQKVDGELETQTAQYEEQKEQIGDIRAGLAEASETGLGTLREKVDAVTNSFKKGLKNVLRWGAALAVMAKNGVLGRLRRSVDGASSGFKTGLKSILGWTIGITSVVALLRKAKAYLKDGFEKYLKLDPETAANVNALKSSLEALKVSWGAAFAPVFNAVIPILQALIGWLQTAAQYVAMFFAMLSGAGSYKRIINNNEALAESYGGAGSAAEKAAGQIMGFDEINKLNDTSGGGGGGGGVAGLSTEDVALETEGFLAQIKDAIDAGDWEGLGKLLGEKVNSIFASVDWAALGTKLGGRLAAVITTAYNFLKTVDFKGIGQNIGTMLTNAMKEIDFHDLGGLLVRRLTAAWDFLIGVVTAPGFASQLATALSDTLTGAMTEFASWLRDQDPAELIGALKDFIEGVNTEELGAAFKEVLGAAWEFAKETGGAIFDGFAEWFEEKFGIAVSEIDFKALHNILSYNIDKKILGEGIANFWWGHKWGEYAGKEIIDGMINGVDGMGSDLKDCLNEDIVNATEGITFQGIIDNLQSWQDAYNEHKAASKSWSDATVADAQAAEDAVSAARSEASGAEAEISDAGGKSADGFWASMKERWGGFGDSWLGQQIQKIKERFSGMKSESEETESAVTAGLQHIGANMLDLDWDAMRQNASDAWNTLSENATTIWGTIHDFLVGETENIDQDVTTNTQKMTADVTGEYDELNTNVSDAANDMKKTMSQTTSEMRNEVDQNTREMSNDVEQTMSGMQTNTSGIVDRIRGLLDFSWSFPKPRMPHISWDWVDVGGLLSLPRFYIDWYARGGVFDTASIIGVGESGAEAVVPLEKNTGWIKTLAEMILEEISQSKYQGALTGMSAVAAGNVAPPLATSAPTPIDAASLAGAIASALAAMNQGNSGNKAHTTVFNINGREFMRATWDDQRAIAKEHGVSLINS